MAEGSDSEEEFEEQLRQEARATQLQEDAGDTEAGDGQGRTKVDPDGTVYEWDAQKKAWFPKIDDDFIARYQMSYGTDNTSAEPSSSTEPSASSSSQTAAEHQAYWDYYNQYYSQYGATQQPDSTSTDKKETGGSPKSKDAEGNMPKTDTETQEAGDGETSEADSTSSYQEYDEYYRQYYSQAGDGEKAGEGQSGQYDEDYWNYYYNYYNQHYGQQPGGEESAKETEAEDKEPETKDEDKGEGSGEGDKGTDKDAAKKRKAKPEEKWFDVEEDKTTSVYVSGLPTDITEEEFRELMTKCGLLLYDHVTRKLKLKLYRDQQGNYKGDGLCGYIKPESVQLALQILDGSEVRGHRISVTKAKFTLKGSFDPKKKKRKLTNKEKRRMKEKQEKLFDWRPDKVAGERPRSDKVIIIKNVFSPDEFEKDPSQINIISQDLRSECSKYGEVKKVKVHDRHLEGVASVTMAEPEEADVCLEAVNGRWFAGRQLSATTWDGRTRYDIRETEEEIKARDAQWEKFLAQEQEEAVRAEGSKKPDGGDKGDSKVVPTLTTDSDSKEPEVNTNSSEPNMEEKNLVDKKEVEKESAETAMDSQTSSVVE